MLAANTILQNRYSIVRELGHGGMGTVYEALDNRVPCLVALKETLLDADEEGREAFEREAGLLGNLHHRALPKVTDHFSENGRLFLVMEYIPGYDFSELMEGREVPFPTPQVLRWANTLFEVLEYLHERNPPVLHRDIKPSNLKLTKEGEIYLIDFGLAKGAAGEMKTLRSNRSMRYLTPAYAPLEQIHGQGTEPRSDLYSLSATIYYLLTGLHPVNAPTRFAALEDGNQDPLILITAVNSQVPAAIAVIIHRGMAISKKARPASAREMREAMLEAEEEERRTAELHRHKEADRNRREEEERQRRLVAEAVQAAESRRRKIDEERRRMQEEETRRELEARQQQAEEQRAREEECRRAEEKRQRDDERRQIAEAAAKQAEEELQRQKAEIRKFEEERKRKTEEKEREEAAARRAEAETKRREEAERQKRDAEEAERMRSREEERRRAQKRKREEELRQKADPLATTPAPTVRSRSQPASEHPKPQPAIQTLKATIPYNSKDLTNDSRGIGTAGELPAEDNGRNRIVKIVAVGFVGILSFVLIVWFIIGYRNSNISSADTSLPTQASQPAKGTQKPTPPAGMVYVPGGEFMMGRNDGTDDGERPAHKVNVSPFYVDIYEVTNEEYSKFVSETKHRRPLSWNNGVYQAGDTRKPVTGVIWDDAKSYAQWAQKRLPTEQEWEFAARGTDGRVYPWGNDWRQESANANGTNQGMADVGSFKGASPFGAFDMIGNAWEWTASDLSAYPRGRLPANLPGGDLKVIRGGSYESTKDSATTTYRTGWPVRGAKTYDQTGFRCVKDLAK